MIDLGCERESRGSKGVLCWECEEEIESTALSEQLD